MALPRPLQHSEQRIIAYQRCRASVSRNEQEAELKDDPRGVSRIRGYPQPCLARRLGPAGQDVPGVLPPSLNVGEKAGFPRFKGRTRYHSFTFKEYGNGARLDNGFLVLSKIGRISVHW